MKILIIIPTYNEKENIEKLISQINQNLTDIDYDILIVDDNSSDGTKEIIKKLRQNNNNLNILNRPEKSGLASAYIDGFRYGIKNAYDIFIQMDADFSHNPQYLKVMIDYLKNYDVVIASRNIKGGKTIGWGILRNLISKCGSFYSRIILGCPIKDLTGGYNGWRKNIIEKINLNKIISKGYSFQIEMKYKAYKNKGKIKEFPIIFKDREYGKSKMDCEIFFEALINILKIRFHKM